MYTRMQIIMGIVLSNQPNLLKHKTKWVVHMGKDYRMRTIKRIIISNALEYKKNKRTTRNTSNLKDLSY